MILSKHVWLGPKSLNRDSHQGRMLFSDLQVRLKKCLCYSSRRKTFFKGKVRILTYLFISQTNALKSLEQWFPTKVPRNTALRRCRGAPKFWIPLQFARIRRQRIHNLMDIIEHKAHKKLFYVRVEAWDWGNTYAMHSTGLLTF